MCLVKRNRSKPIAENLRNSEHRNELVASQEVTPAHFGSEVTTEEYKRKCKYIWQYVCNYNKAEYKYSRVWLSEKNKTKHAYQNPIMFNSKPQRLYMFNRKFI